MCNLFPFFKEKYHHSDMMYVLLTCEIRENFQRDQAYWWRHCSNHELTPSKKVELISNTWPDIPCHQRSMSLAYNYIWKILWDNYKDFFLKSLKFLRLLVLWNLYTNLDVDINLSDKHLKYQMIPKFFVGASIWCQWKQNKRHIHGVNELILIFICKYQFIRYLRDLCNKMNSFKRNFLEQIISAID